MAISSFGYKGTIDEREWARMTPHISAARYGVVGTDDLRVTAVSGADRTVQVGTGTGWGPGVMDEIDTPVTLQSSTVGSGSRWDTIVLRRDWGTSPGSTELRVIEGGPERTIAPSRESSPGLRDDQPLALVRYQAGQTQPQEIVDLRCWASNGGAQIVAEEAFQYLAHPGSTVWFNWRMYNYLRLSNGTWRWQKLADMGLRNTLPLTALGSAWAVQGTVSAAQDPPHRITNLNAQIYRNAGAITVPADRWLAVGYLLPAAYLMPREPWTGETVMVFPGVVRLVGTATSFTSSYRNVLIYLDVRDGTFRIRAADGGAFTINQWARIYVNITWNVPFDAA